MKAIHFIIYILLLGNLAIAQQTKNIKILDANNNDPISFAHYKYGDQKGVSDENGLIQIIFNPDLILDISHINYGVFSLNETEILQAFQDGFWHQKQLNQYVQPVTIIGFKAQNHQIQDDIEIKHQDKLEHDGVKILRELPAFNSVQKGGNYGFDPVFRGFKYDQLNIVMNGAQGATAACPNRMDPPTSQMSPNMMDRVEILKGPYALRYGTGIGATINFVQADLQFVEKTTVFGRISSAYESNGNSTKGESQIGFRGEKYDISLLGSWSQGNDYRAANDSKIAADFFRASIGSNLGFKINEQNSLRLSIMYNQAKDVDFPALPMDLRDDKTWMFSATHKAIINRGNLSSWNTTVYGSLVDHKMDNLLKELDPRMLNASTTAKTYNYGGRTEGVWLFKKSKLFTGLDTKVEGAQGSRERAFIAGPNAGKVFFDNAWQEAQIIRSALFAEYQFNGKHFNLILAGRGEFNASSVKDIANEFDLVYASSNTVDFNPNVSLGVIKPIKDKMTLALWLGRAQRSGGLTEKYINFFPVGQDPYEMIGNPNLKPEVNNQLDLTFAWKPMDKTIIDIDVFASYMQDYISSVIDTSLKPRLPNSPGVRQFINIEKAIKTGIEMNWHQKLWFGLQHEVSFAYTYGEDLTRKEALPEIAPFDIRYKLVGNYFNNKLRPEIQFRYVAWQTRVSTEFGESETPSFSLVNIKLSYQATERFNVSGSVNNLFDQLYYEHLTRSVTGPQAQLYAPGRNFIVNLNYQF